MASIYKRGRIWWIHYLVGGKSVSRSLRTSNERVALEKKRRLREHAFEGDVFSQLIIAVIERRLEDARSQTVTLFQQSEGIDAKTAGEMSSGGISEEEVVERLGKRSVTQAISVFLEYLKVGLVLPWVDVSWP
jgi:hypothetical protein